MRTILVDFLVADREIDDYEPIGCWLTSPDGSQCEVRYTEFVEEEPLDEYLRTMGFLEQWLEAQRIEDVDWPTVLVRAADNSYLGLKFRSIGHVEDDVEIDAAFVRYVVQGVRLDDRADEELPSGL